MLNTNKSLSELNIIHNQNLFRQKNDWDKAPKLKKVPKIGAGLWKSSKVWELISFRYF